MDDLVNECLSLYKEIKKSLKSNGFTQLDGTVIQEDIVSIGIGSDYYTALITQCVKNGEVIAVNIEVDLEQIVIFGGEYDKYMIDETLVRHKTFTFEQKVEASKYFELLLSDYR